MKDYASKDVRNVVLLGHAGSGKSTFVESALFKTKAIDRMGKASDGSLAMDYEPEEAKRGQSVFTAIAPVEWKNTKINFIDTPGYLDYEGEKITGVVAADNILCMVSAKDGIESGTESAVKLARKYSLPLVFFVNKLDEDNANYEKVVGDLQAQFGSSAIPFILPDGSKALNKEGAAADYYDQIAEAIASADEALMDKFFEGTPFTPEEKARKIVSKKENGQ